MITPFGNPSDYSLMANAIRVLSMEGVEQAQSGHPGMPMGMADVVTVLYRDFLQHAPADPHWFNRDRFILSAGHGSMLLYSLLHLTGYPDLSLDALKNFRQLHSKTPGHPEYRHTPGVETTTGPLGQGFANAVGMAIAEEKLRHDFGEELINHRTYVLVGDGCLMEGISQEALSLAGHLNLAKLIVLFDDNHITIDGPTSLSTRDDTLKRFQASGWQTLEIDGHDHAQIYGALTESHLATGPILIKCRTTIAYGAPKKGGTAAAHGSPLGREEIEAVRQFLGWTASGWDIPASARDLWTQAATRCTQEYAQWTERWNASNAQQELKRRLAQEIPQEALAALNTLRTTWETTPPSLASRQASQAVLESVFPVMPELFGGSADLTPSNNTRTKTMTAFSESNRGASYLHYGIREHAMVAAMSGIALHGGLLPYGGTFLAFSDYCRPAIRLAALMRIPSIYVMTHDSIGLGEDGPTHQPIEHLAALRAIPHLHVFRPADALETLECWELALARKDGPSLLALSRQTLTPLPQRLMSGSACSKGGYVVVQPTRPRELTLLSTGSEVMLAVKAAERLEQQGIATAVVSLPCWELFAAQPPLYQAETLGTAGKRLAIEAACRWGWDAYLRPGDGFVGLNDFGASAPAQALYTFFGITIDAIEHHALQLIK